MDNFTSLVDAKVALCVSLRLVVVLFLPHQLVGLCPHCRSCDQDCTCFSIALNHLKSYNDIYTDWSLYHKICSKNKCPDQQHKKIKIKIKKKKHTDTHTQAPEVTIIHACMHTPTCRHTNIHANTLRRLC